MEIKAVTLLILQPVLPGPEAASPLIEQKITAINTHRYFKFFQNSATFPLFKAFSVHFWKQFVLNCIRLFSPNICQTKFRYFSATFG
jgi:hypothetical protein